jgi:Aspartyl protease/PDZ domain
MRPLAMTLLVLVFAHAPAQGGAATSTTVPFAFVDNRIFVPCSIGGKGPFSLLVDTGASGVLISPAVSAALGLTVRSAGTTSGAGSRRATIGTAELAVLAVGGMRFRHVRAVVLDLGEIRRGIGFPRFDGIIGSSILRGLRTRVDMDTARLTLSTAAIVPPPGARAVPFELADELIRLPARIDGLQGTVVLDTGDRSSLTIFRGFARAHRIYDRPTGVRNALTGFGVGGPVYGDVFRLRDLDVLGVGIPGVVARASRDRGGVFATASEAGSIGGGVLRRFNVIYDYPARKLLVWRSRAFAATDRYDPAGMWLSLGPRGPVVTALRPGGPAAAAGLRVNDVLLAVDGRSVAVASLPALRDGLNARPDGAQVRLTLRRAPDISVVRTLTLHQAV